ncbi:hypothetical protein DFH06DRAFT_1327634 [Mycena polygramma]|nr:hypothetical protein DFH06DRAFT_1327634 [Mycena polygramma]
MHRPIDWEHFFGIQSRGTGAPLRLDFPSSFSKAWDLGSFRGTRASSSIVPATPSFQRLFATSFQPIIRVRLYGARLELISVLLKEPDKAHGSRAATIPVSPQIPTHSLIFNNHSQIPGTFRNPLPLPLPLLYIATLSGRPRQAFSWSPTPSLAGRLPRAHPRCQRGRNHVTGANYISLSSQYSMVLESWPSRHSAQVLISANSDSLFARNEEIVASIYGAGLSKVSLDFEALQNQGNKGDEPYIFRLDDIDTLHTEVVRATLSWFFCTDHWPHRTLRTVHGWLRFHSPTQLDAFLFALSYIRLSQAYCPVARSPLHKPAEHHCYEFDVNEFYTMRAISYTHATTHILPAEILSTIFLFFSQSPLLLLQICSTWRAVAMGTPPLWCDPSFTLRRSFFYTRNPSFDHRHHNSVMQMSSWLTRARSVPITLSLTFHSSGYGDRFDRENLGPLTFGSVKILGLYCTQPQLLHFLGDDAPMLPSLETLSITVPQVSFHSCGRPVRLCRSAPLLRSLTIETESFTVIGDHHGLVTTFPWPRLTRLSLQIELHMSTWIPIFFQCLSLQSGDFILRRARRSDPVTPTVFRDLASLRISFSGPSDTGFFDRVVFPVLRELHLTAGELDLEPMPILPTLRVLILDTVVPELVLQRIISAHPKLVELSVKTLHGGVCPDIWGLRYLRILTICAFISDPDLVQTFVQDTAARVVQAVSAGCSLRIFAEEATLDSVRIALADEHRVKVSIHCDPSLIPSPKPVDRLLSPRLFFFLTVERLLAL